MYYLLAFAAGIILGMFIGYALTFKVLVYLVQRYWLAQGLNWDAVDRNVKDVLDLERLRYGPPFWKWHSEDARKREAWEAYKASRENAQ